MPKCTRQRNRVKQCRKMSKTKRQLPRHKNSCGCRCKCNYCQRGCRCNNNVCGRVRKTLGG